MPVPVALMVLVPSFTVRVFPSSLLTMELSPLVMELVSPTIAVPSSLVVMLEPPTLVVTLVVPLMPTVSPLMVVAPVALPIVAFAPAFDAMVASPFSVEIPSTVSLPCIVVLPATFKSAPRSVLPLTPKSPVTCVPTASLMTTLFPPDCKVTSPAPGSTLPIVVAAVPVVLILVVPVTSRVPVISVSPLMAFVAPSAAVMVFPFAPLVIEFVLPPVVVVMALPFAALFVMVLSPLAILF